MKGIEYAAFASEETHCYSATLYVDGVKWGVVGNEGHGGCDYFHGVPSRNYDAVAALDKLIAATYPAKDVGCMYADGAAPGTHMMEESLECLCSDIVNTYLVGKELRRALRSKFLFTKPGQPGIFQIPLKQKGRVYTADAVEKAAAARTPGIQALNNMPFDAALALYRAGA